MTYRLAGVAVGALICLTLAAPASGATRVIRYTPFTATGEIKRSVRVADTADGDCSGGAVTRRSDAYRCFAGHFVYDPCFESPIANIAVCPVFPGSRDAVVLTDPDFDREFQPKSTAGTVWAVRVGRHRCAASSGARSIVRGRAPRYFCDRGNGPAVWGALDRRRRTWRALLGTYNHPARWRWRSVRIAWR